MLLGCYFRILKTSRRLSLDLTIMPYSVTRFHQKEEVERFFHCFSRESDFLTMRFKWRESACALPTSSNLLWSLASLILRSRSLNWISPSRSMWKISTQKTWPTWPLPLHIPNHLTIFSLFYWIATLEVQCYLFLEKCLPLSTH